MPSCLITNDLYVRDKVVLSFVVRKRVSLQKQRNRILTNKNTNKMATVVETIKKLNKNVNLLCRKQQI